MFSDEDNTTKTRQNNNASPSNAENLLTSKLKEIKRMPMMGEKESRNKIQQDYEYISNDPEENADNFDPKWASFREMTTDEERYQAIRKRWGNKDIPDPQTNLTFRHIKNESDSDDKENQCSVIGSNPIGIPADSTNINRRNRKVSRRRSRSCTRPYEQLISNLEKNYTMEYSQLMHKHRAELAEMLQIHHWRMGACNSVNHFFGNNISLNLKIQQNNEVINLLSNQEKEVSHLIGEKKEDIYACIKYMEEVKAFFTFYQKINDDEVTLQMTDEQYEHTVETEKMYSLYSKFYI